MNKSKKVKVLLDSVVIDKRNNHKGPGKVIEMTSKNIVTVEWFKYPGMFQVLKTKDLDLVVS